MLKFLAWGRPRLSPSGRGLPGTPPRPKRREALTPPPLPGGVGDPRLVRRPEGGAVSHAVRPEAGRGRRGAAGSGGGSRPSAVACPAPICSLSPRCICRKVTLVSSLRPPLSFQEWPCERMVRVRFGGRLSARGLWQERVQSLLLRPLLYS